MAFLRQQVNQDAHRYRGEFSEDPLKESHVLQLQLMSYNMIKKEYFILFFYFQETWASQQTDIIMMQEYSGSGSGDCMDDEDCDGSGSGTDIVMTTTMGPDSGESRESKLNRFQGWKGQ